MELSSVVVILLEPLHRFSSFHASSFRRRVLFLERENDMIRPKFIGMLIVIPIVLLAAAIIIPCLIPAHGPANESSAVANLRTINHAEETYRDAYGRYADSLANLGGPQPCLASAATACLIDRVLASGVKSGYRFTVGGTNPVKGA